MTKPNQPPITFDPPNRGEYGMIYHIHHRNWRKLTPEPASYTHLTLPPTPHV